MKCGIYFNDKIYVNNFRHNVPAFMESLRVWAVTF